MTADNKLVLSGAAALAVAVLCCFAPLLAVLLGVAGFAALLGFAGYALVPALVLLVLFAGCWVFRQRRSRQPGRHLRTDWIGTVG
ncbi:MAG TPA: mercury resistance system transport protein MerF [Stellaceae bacterium]|nr:mercury resistance system transport protein MerF [Stellaceae bacterium]